MNQHLQKILDLIEQEKTLSAEEKNTLIKSLKDADKEFEITNFKLDRTEKVKRTTAILLEETIEELEQKRKAVEAQNRELEIESSLERVRTVAMSMNKPDDMLEVCKTIALQLQSLGVKEIRNVQTAIFYQERGTYMNYEFYAKHDKTFITETVYTNHEVPKAFAEQMFKGKGEVYITHIKDKEVKDWLVYQKTTNVFIDSFLETATSLNYYWHSLGPVALGISTYNPLSGEELQLFQRFLKVFDLSYRRYLDIEKAIAQAREAKIEAALEKVRSRSLAMHKSDELNEVVTILFEKIKELQIPVTAVGIGIYIGGSKNMNTYVCGENEDRLVINNYCLPYFQHKIWKDLNNAREKQMDFFSGNYSKEEKNSFYKYVLEHSALRHLPVDVKSLIFESPAYTISMVPVNHSMFMINNFEGKILSENEVDIIKRFARVFDQTYTRFLDLQKAEVQARESQIQLALERVRARTMAMQKSDELREVVATMYEQLQLLDIKYGACTIIIMDTATGNMQHWVGGFAQKLYPESYQVNYFKHSFIDTQLAQWKSGEKYAVVKLSGENKKAYDTVMFTQTDFKNFPEETKQWMAALDPVVFSIAYMTHGALTWGPEAISEDYAGILQRFAKVFEQTYTRFLDLKKAEAQAREAEIELALERVRAVAMAMQQSGELVAISEVMYKELTSLGFSNIRNAQIAIENDEKQSFIFYNYSDDNKQDIREASYNSLSILADAKQRLQTSGAFYEEEYTGEKLEEWRNWKKNGNAALNERELSAESLRWYLYGIGKGHMGISTFNAISEEQVEIVKRFKNVFELSYRRFDDLQKAEAQTKEAQIETALERVRSRSMGMQKSEELQEVIKLVYQQLTHLKINLDHAGFVVDYTPGGYWHFWIADEQDIPSKITHPWFESVWANQFNEAKEKGANFFATHLNFEEKNKFYNELLSYVPGLPEASKDFYLSCPGLAASTVLFDNVSLYMENFAGIPYTEEEDNTLMRFGKVFQQTYTRFLDLQKAEAQVREAKIEAALEKVRSRSLAMHNTSELQEVIHTVYKELLNLNMAINGGSFIAINTDVETTLRCWGSGGTADTSEEVHIPLYEKPFCTNLISRIKNGPGFFTEEYTNKEKKDFFTFLFTHEPWSKLDAKQKKETLSSPGGYTRSCCVSQHTSIFIINHFGEIFSADDNDILQRFAKVFEQAYTRFLDLQKAEAQAREAQIQLALERGRTQSMIMQHSNELDDTLRVFHEQILLLNIRSAFSFLWLPDEEKNNHLFWAAWAEDNNDATVFKSKAITYPLDRNEPATAQCLIDWKSGEPVFSYAVPPEAVEGYFAAWQELIDGVEKLTPAHFINGLYYAEAFMKYGCFGVMLESDLNDNEKKILNRFAVEFERAYTRFLDLQKAEAQAREAQIQLALERVRARTMAMHRSDELLDTSMLLFQQIKELGEMAVQNSIAIVNEEAGFVELSSSIHGSHLPHTLNVPVDDPYLMAKGVAAWKAKLKSLTVKFEGQELKNYNELRNSFLETKVSFPEDQWIVNLSFFSRGWLSFSSNKNVSDEIIGVQKRFAAVFEQTYTRFLDLQKAEAQTKEAQIETALEKVRSRTMAMQHSDELQETAAVLFQEFKKLGTADVYQVTIGIYNKEDGIIDFRVTSWAGSGEQENRSFHLDMNEPTVLQPSVAAWKANKKSLVIDLTGEALEEWINYRNKMSGVTIRSQDTEGRRVISIAYFSKGHISISTPVPAPQETIKTLERFAAVFDGTYTRFLDLEKAEAQARQAKIEAAMEKVRSRAMAMQKPNELVEVAELLRREMGLLGVEELETSSIYIHHEDTKKTECWYAIKDVADTEKKLVSDHMNMDLNDTWVGRQMLEFYRSDKKQISISMKGDNRREWINYCADHSKVLVGYYGDTVPDRTYHLYKFSNGYMGAASPGEISAESWDLLQRATSVFSLAYTRFSDLQQAEAQAREAKIEAALERVRSVAMSMMKSADLGTAVAVVFEELDKLYLKTLRCGIAILSKEKRSANVWTTSTTNEGTVVHLSGDEPMDIHPLLQNQFEAWLKKEDFAYTLEEDDLLEYYKAVSKTNLNLPEQQNNLSKNALSRQFYFSSSFTAGGVFTFRDTAFPEEAKSVLKRFANVFDLTYQRFLDLQKAEAQAREAQIETALERVRSRTMSMQKSDELAETAAEVFRQLISLGIEPNRLYIGIVKEETGNMEMWATDEDGTHVGKKFMFNKNENISVKKLFDGWKAKEKSVIVDMQGKELEDYFHYLNNVMHIPFKSGLTQKRRVQSVAYFSKGFIGMASPDGQGDETIQLLERFAAVFNLTFTRFNDLKIAEAHAQQAEEDLIAIKEAKQKAEAALTELQSAQKQLIQSEKMASLGELTAGIAHEIQNPLNFVNNFSEVSKELLDEMREAIEKGDTAEAKEIMNDVIQNLEKINHHGKRAGDIVKGMLQHSRSSSGVKEPTDINALADEYLRLAYHGLRAKDKSFNATLKTDYDENIGKVNIIPQDIGRVILNLFTNAFYAVTERKKQQPQGYESTVSVSTKKMGEGVEISVKDNGNGIPHKVLDKIFQPFFTTKPTGQGTGLGLSLSYDIVKAHGGELKVNTTEGKGTIFTIELNAKG